jgi:hypothetical protein
MDVILRLLNQRAYGDYEEAMRETVWKLAKARHEERRTIKALGCSPIGHAGYERLRQQILSARASTKTCSDWT